jgi:hypothetical protein
MNAPTSPTPPGEATPAAAEAGIGHNRPPAFDPAVLVDLAGTVDEFMSVTQQWLQLEAIENDQQSEQMADQITGLRGLWKKVDAARKDAKKPHDEAGKAVQAAFSPLLAKLKAAADTLKPKLATYTEAKAAREAEEKRKAEEEARAMAAAAEQRAKMAEMEGDIGAKVEAEEEAKAAEKEAKAAAKGPDTKVKSASGGGRTMSMRTIKEVEVVNVLALFGHYRAHPDVIDTLRRLATADVRAKDYDHAANPIPGIEITERKAMA